MVIEKLLGSRDLEILKYARIVLSLFKHLNVE